MKHLYKTKEGEILEALKIDYENNILTHYNDGHWGISLDEVQEVVLNKDGEPFMIGGEVVCVGNFIDSEHLYKSGEIKCFLPTDNGIFFLLENNDWIKSHNVTSHLPKHPQKKGIEKIEVDIPTTPNDTNRLAEKLNEIIEVVNKLTK